MSEHLLSELENNRIIEKIKKYYDIGFCNIDDYEDLMNFISVYWSENHIFLKSKNLFDWQHYDKGNNRYNFVIARNKATREIDSILGFVPTKQYDECITKYDIWPCIWKTKSEGLGIGIALYKFLTDNIETRSILLLGISELALRLYKKLNFNCGKINQYYMINKEKIKFNLIADFDGRYFFDCNEYENSPKGILMNCSEEEFGEIEDKFFDEIKQIPCKSKRYYINRFYKHPVYKYDIFKVLENNKIKAILFAREVSNGLSSALRIVDFCGDIKILAGMHSQFQKLMTESNIEYIDFLNAGIDEKYFNNAGFIKKQFNTAKKEIIIPNYYEPFILKNIELDYAWKTIDGNEPIFFKADADQDRPNIL